jgi:hypothetical protein
MRSSDPARRLLTRGQAAEYCGLKPSAFSAWVAAGRMPAPLPGTRRWDIRALDQAIDRLSGVDSDAVSDAAPDAADAAIEKWLRGQTCL